MYNLKQGFEEFLSHSGFETKIPEKAKMMLKQAWMAGASCVLKEFAAMHNKNPKQSMAMMQGLGKEAYAYDQYKDDINKELNAEIDAHAKAEGHNPIGFGGLFALPYLMSGGYGSWGGYPGYGYGFGGGFPSMYSQSVRMQHTDHDGDRHRDWHDRHDHWRDKDHDARAYGKDYVDKAADDKARPTREKYPDIEAARAEYDAYMAQKMQQRYPTTTTSSTTPSPHPIQDGKVYSTDGKTYTYQGHTYYADGRLIQ